MILPGAMVDGECGGSLGAALKVAGASLLLDRSILRQSASSSSGQDRTSLHLLVHGHYCHHQEDKTVVLDVEDDDGEEEEDHQTIALIVTKKTTTKKKNKSNWSLRVFAASALANSHFSHKQRRRRRLASQYTFRDVLLRRYSKFSYPRTSPALLIFARS